MENTAEYKYNECYIPLDIAVHAEELWRQDALSVIRITLQLCRRVMIAAAGRAVAVSLGLLVCFLACWGQAGQGVSVSPAGTNGTWVNLGMSARAVVVC